MSRLLIATSNPAKLRELSRFLSGIPAQIISLTDAGITARADETGSSIEENAVLKARFYHGISGIPTIADDGGFEIDSLGGEPGVRSHRWPHGDRDATDDELITYTMKRMEHISEGRRGAQLRVVVAFAAGSVLQTAEATVRGVIPDRPSDMREPGFPYRSLLYLPELGKFYQHDALTPEENERLNHRRYAVEKLVPVIRRYLTSGSDSLE
jgi:XTP/dITP diphosphohydrolase